MKTEVKEITPDIAYEMLKNNTKNRNFKNRVVLDYARQMKGGQWKLTAQGISIADDGTIIDGQHRLAAIVKSGTPIKTTLTTGLHYDDVFKVYDSGVKRSAADSLHISGVKNPSLIASGIRKQYTLINGNVKIKMTTSEIYDVYFDNIEVYQEIARISNALHSKIKLIPISLLDGLIAYLHINKSHELEDVHSFFHQLYHNKDVINDNIDMLRDKLLSNLIGSKRMTDRVRLMYLMKTWNNYVNGIEHKKLTIDLNRDSNLKFI